MITTLSINETNKLLNPQANDNDIIKRLKESEEFRKKLESGDRTDVVFDLDGTLTKLGQVGRIAASAVLPVKEISQIFIDYNTIIGEAVSQSQQAIGQDNALDTIDGIVKDAYERIKEYQQKIIKHRFDSVSTNKKAKKEITDAISTSFEKIEFNVEVIEALNWLGQFEHVHLYVSTGDFQETVDAIITILTNQGILTPKNPIERAGTQFEWESKELALSNVMCKVVSANVFIAFVDEAINDFDLWKQAHLNKGFTIKIKTDKNKDHELIQSFVDDRKFIEIDCQGIHYGNALEDEKAETPSSSARYDEQTTQAYNRVAMTTASSSTTAANAEPSAKRHKPGGRPGAG